MRSLKLGLAATAMICALSATAQAADCVRVAVAGEALTHDIAVLFSTNGLKNIIYGQGRVGQGPVQHDLQDRLRYDDVSLLADGVQSDNSQNLLGRLACASPCDPVAWRQRRIARPWKSASIRFGNASSNQSEDDSPAMKFIALGLTGFDPDALGDVAEIKDAVGTGHEADPGEERVTAGCRSNAAISDTFGDASNAVMPTSAFVIPAASRTNALANEAKSAFGTNRPFAHRPRFVNYRGYF